MLDAGRRMARVARDVQLVDDAVRQRPPQRLVALPVVVVGRGNFDAKRRSRSALDRGLAIPYGVADDPRVRVEQLAPRVEAQAGGGLGGAVDAPRIEPAGARAGDERVPEAIRPVSRGVECDLGDRLRVGRRAIEAQPDACRARAEDGEIHAAVLHGRAERQPRPGSEAELRRWIVAPRAQSLRIKPSSYGCDSCGWSGTARTSYSSVPAHGGSSSSR